MNPLPAVTFINDVCNRLNQYESRLNLQNSRIQTLESRQNDFVALTNRVSQLEARLAMMTTTLTTPTTLTAPTIVPISVPITVNITASTGTKGGPMTFTYEGGSTEQLFTQFSETAESWGNFEAPMTLSGGTIYRPFVPLTAKFLRLATLSGAPLSNVFTL